MDNVPVRLSGSFMTLLPGICSTFGPEYPETPNYLSYKDLRYQRGCLPCLALKCPITYAKPYPDSTLVYPEVSLGCL